VTECEIIHCGSRCETGFWIWRASCVEFDSGL